MMLSEQDVAAYRRDGVIVVPNVLDAAMVCALRGVIADLIAAISRGWMLRSIVDGVQSSSPE